MRRYALLTAALVSILSVSPLAQTSTWRPVVLSDTGMIASGHPLASEAGLRILKSGGTLTLIWRADGIGEVLAALGRGFGSLAILPVHGDARTPAIRVLVRATKGGRAPAQIHPALMLNDESGVPNEEVQEVLAGKRVLPLATL